MHGFEDAEKMKGILEPEGGGDGLHRRTALNLVLTHPDFLPCIALFSLLSF